MSLTRFNVLGKVIEDGLLSLALLLRGVFGFSVERDTDREPVGAGHELDSASPVSKRILNQLFWHDLGVGPREVKAKAAVFSLHAR